MDFASNLKQNQCLRTVHIKLRCKVIVSLTDNSYQVDESFSLKQIYEFLKSPRGKTIIDKDFKL